MRSTPRILSLLLTAGYIWLSRPASGQLVVNYGFVPNATVPDNGQFSDVRVLGGFASYSNFTVNLNLTSHNLNDPMFLGDMYSTLTHGTAIEAQRAAVLLNRPGRDNMNAFGSSLSALNVTLDDTAANNVWGTTSTTGTYRSDGRLGVNPFGAAVPFSDGDRNAPLSALNGAALASNRFTLLVADTNQGGTATLASWGLHATGAAAASGTLSAGGGTMSIADTGMAAVNNIGAMVVTTQSDAGPLVVDIAGTMSFNGGVTGSSGLTKQGNGTLTVNSVGTYTGATIINGGVLNAAATNALQSTPSITVNNGGTLLLSNSGTTDRINDAATVTMGAGSTFDTGGLSEGTAPAPIVARALAKKGLVQKAPPRYSNQISYRLLVARRTLHGKVLAEDEPFVPDEEFLAMGSQRNPNQMPHAPFGTPSGLGALTLQGTQAAPVIFDFGTLGGSALIFDMLNPSGKGSYVNILNWSGSSDIDNGALGNDRLLFVNNPGFSLADLANFNFTGFGPGATQIDYNGYYEIVPTAVPEPATWVAGFLTVAAIGSTQRKRLRVVFKRGAA